MRTLLIVLLALMATNVRPASGATEAPPPPDRLTGSEVQFIVLVSAYFYCSQHHWPKDVAEMMQFRDSGKVLARITVREEVILSAKLMYVTEPSFALRAPSFIKNKRLVIDARQDPPRCSPNGDVKLQGAQMSLDIDQDSGVPKPDA